MLRFIVDPLYNDEAVDSTIKDLHIVSISIVSFLEPHLTLLSGCLLCGLKRFQVQASWQYLDESEHKHLLQPHQPHNSAISMTTSSTPI